MEKNLNARQIIKYANSKKLVDAMDEIDTIYNGGNKQGQFNKKVILNVNEFGIQGHKEKQASFFWNIHDALIVCDDIVNGRFENECYGMYKDKGRTEPILGNYSAYGGGKEVSRILQIGVKDGNYIIQVSLYKAIVGKNGSIMPDKNNKIDAHNIQLDRYNARKFFKAIQATIESKLDKLTVLPSLIPMDTTPPAPKQTEQPKKQEYIDPFSSDSFDPFAS